MSVSATYDLIVIGGGAAGLTASQVATALGWRVALIERHLTGGECTWTGCVPSKTLIAAARLAHHVRHAATYGVIADSVRVDFAALMAHLRATIQHIYAEENPEALRRLGMEVYTASARFHDPHHLDLSTGERLRAKYIIIATGAKPHIPDGFSDVPYLTHETLFNLTAQPTHLGIVGGGAIGVEMAQAFQRLGTQVTLISHAPRLLMQDEPEASAFIQQRLQAEGVRMVFNTRAMWGQRRDERLFMGLEDGTRLEVSHVLIAAGKRVDVSDLDPRAGRLATQEDLGQVLLVNDQFQTSQAHIFAAGDVTGAPYFTHVAGSEAVAAVLNVLLPVKLGKRKAYPPWATYTDPEVAHVGMTVAQAQAQYGDVQTTHLPMHRADRAMTEAQSEGFIQVVHRRGGKLLGATIVGHNAAEMMNEWLHILERGGSVRDAALSSHIYPTLGSTNAIVGLEQLRAQLQSGHWLGQVARWLSTVRLRLS